MPKVNVFHRLVDLLEEERRRNKKEVKKAAKKEVPHTYAFINPFHNV